MFDPGIALHFTPANSLVQLKRNNIKRKDGVCVANYQ